MECEQIIELLSDLHDGILPDGDRVIIQEHLALCLPCNKVFYELKVIVSSAKELHREAGIAFPDKTVIWQRMALSSNGK